MKLLWSAMCVLLGTVSAHPMGGSGNDLLTPPPQGKDIEIMYSHVKPNHLFNYGACIPYKFNGYPVHHAKFKEPVVCTVYRDDSCKEKQNCVPFPLPGEIQINNILGIGSILSGSYNCTTLAHVTDALCLMPDTLIPTFLGSPDAGADLTSVLNV